MAEDAPKKKKAGPGPDDMFKIVIEEVDGMPNFETVTVEGKVYQIMRGQEVEVPYAVLHVLENSKATKLVKEVIDGKANLVPREVNTVPYRVLR